MRACQQCGLSIGDTATFCPVCGALADPGDAPPPPQPPSARPVSCALCGHPGPLVDVESFRLCGRCQGQLELLVDREPRSGATIRVLTTEEDARRSVARTVDGRYSSILDGDTCDVCAAMDDRTTTDLDEAQGRTPNKNCTNPDGCRCVVFFEMTSLGASDVRAFLEYAVGHILPATAQAVEGFHEEVRSRDREVSRRLHAASDHVSEARRCEKTDAPRAAALYRQAIVEYLESSEDPLDSQFVRRDVQYVVDRLSLVLKRSGLLEEALEEIDCAASLGLVDREDSGTKAQREALNKRRISLRRAVAKAAHDKG